MVAIQSKGTVSNQEERNFKVAVELLEEIRTAPTPAARAKLPPKFGLASILLITENKPILDKDKEEPLIKLNLFEGLRPEYIL